MTVRWEPISDGGTEPLCMKQSAGVDAGIPCVCAPPTPPPATLAPTAWACGAGRNMVVQETVDPTRNSPPWDLPSASNGFEGSLYFSVGVTSGSGGPWVAGGEHFKGIPNPVETGPLTWDTGGFIQMNGFGDGYDGKTYAAPPGAAIAVLSCDPEWGQPNAAPMASAEMPHQFVNVSAIPQSGSPSPAAPGSVWTISG